MLFCHPNTAQSRLPPKMDTGQDRCELGGWFNYMCAIIGFHFICPIVWFKVEYVNKKWFILLVMVYQVKPSHKLNFSKISSVSAHLFLAPKEFIWKKKQNKNKNVSTLGKWSIWQRARYIEAKSVILWQHH